jgi:hypothetical protein
MSHRNDEGRWIESARTGSSRVGLGRLMLLVRKSVIRRSNVAPLNAQPTPHFVRRISPGRTILGINTYSDLIRSRSGRIQSQTNLAS